MDPEDRLSQFPGYGESVTMGSHKIRLSPVDSKRWVAARVHDDRRRDWYI